jgi:Na+/H+-dicarboxylate symporter
MKIPLHWKVIIGLVLGAGYAFLAVTFDWISFTLDYIKPLGDIFINLLKLIAVPLVMFSVISGVVSLQDINKLGRLGLKTLSLYLVTTLFAVSLGLIVVNIIQPGSKPEENMLIDNRINYEVWRNQNQIKKLDEICLSCEPQYAEKLNILKEKSEQKDNAWLEEKIKIRESERNKSPLQPLVDVVPSNIFKSLIDMAMIQVIFFSILFGVVLLLISQEKAKPVINLMEGLNEVFVKMVELVMRAMPIFVFALMAGQVVAVAGNDISKFVDMLVFLGWYSLAVLTGLFIMILMVYPLLAKFLGKVGYGHFFAGIKEAQITAFSTSSSIATLPVTMDCIHHKLKVPKSISSFVLPIGATVNMDGTSLYQAVAVVALAQFHMVDLDLAQQLIIVFTATLASIGAAAIPSAGLVLMIVVLESVGLNPLWIAIIFPVDRILDMFRTVVNVTGDATVSTIIANSEKDNIKN